MTDTFIEKETIDSQPVVETVIEDNSDKLSPREALEQAIIEKREVRSDTSDKPAREAPTQKEVTAAVNADPEPPSEFNDAEIRAWKDKDILGIQNGFKRLATERHKEMSRAQTAEKQAREDAKTWRQLGEMAAPYIESRGTEGVTPQQAIMEALALIQEFKKGDPSTVKAELKRIGIDLDTAPVAALNKLEIPEIKTIQQDLQLLKEEYQKKQLKEVEQTFDSIFKELSSQKTRTGDTVFPGLLDNSESGMQFAKEIGSLTQDQGFRSLVLRRFPDANDTVIVREAYIALGGKVAGEAVKVSTSNTKHIEKSRRAAASSPQGSTMRSRTDSSNLVGKLSARAALQKALEEQQEH